MFGVDSGDRVICGLLETAIQHYEAEKVLSPNERLIYASVSLFLVVVAGICAGLTLGLLSLSPLDLELIKRTATSPQDKLMAVKVERVTRNPHQLLVCLLVVNAACMEALPLCLDRLLNPVAAILISVTAIVIGGEVVPQAVCKKYGLQIGASLAWLVHIMMFITWPISYPIGKLLDWSLGNHGKAFFRRAELKEFVTLHGEAPEEEGATESILTTEECQVIHGALDMAHKTAETAMTPLEKIFSISADAPFDKLLLQKIIDAGHSRVPVYVSEDSNSKPTIIGLILVKELLMHEPNGSLKIKECNVREIDFLVADTPLYAVMKLFQVKRRHMAAVIKCNRIPSSSTGISTILGGIEEGEEENFETYQDGSGSPVVFLPSSIESTGEVIGIITAEDVLEELLQTEWQDETDRYLDNRFEVRVAPTPRNTDLPPGLLRYVVAQRHNQFYQQQERPGRGRRASTLSRQKDTRVQQQQQHLPGSPPHYFKERSSINGGGDENEKDDDSAPLLDV